MSDSRTAQANVVSFPTSKKRAEKARKSGLNHNKEGSVRNVNGKVYVDFIYLGERVRESSGLSWNEKNAKSVREQLDKIIVKIKDGTFRFAEVFPESKNRECFDKKERETFGLQTTPDQVVCKDFFSTWYNLLKNSGRVQGRTLLGYKSYMNLYLTPFFADLPFGDLSATTFERFTSWARQQQYRAKEIENKTINKIFTVLKMICKSAAIEYGWGRAYDPFFGFKKLPENDAYESIFPFSIEDQKKLLDHLPEHWTPYFRFAFSSGLRAGEQIALMPGDIDWDKQVIHIRRAITRSEDGKRVEGSTKNRYSRRTIKLIPEMREALEEQQRIYDRFQSKYFFCTKTGARIDIDNLRDRVWTPALKCLNLPYREIKQTRHTFATIALSCGENPLWIAQVMGHRNTDMIINVYGKYVENARGTNDGGLLSRMLQGENGKEE